MSAQSRRRRRRVPPFEKDAHGLVVINKFIVAMTTKENTQSYFKKQTKT
jgi:hypothetical protein